MGFGLNEYDQNMIEWQSHRNCIKWLNKINELMALPRNRSWKRQVTVLNGIKFLILLRTQWQLGVALGHNELIQNTSVKSQLIQIIVNCSSIYDVFRRVRNHCLWHVTFTTMAYPLPPSQSLLHLCSPF